MSMNKENEGSAFVEGINFGVIASDSHLSDSDKEQIDEVVSKYGINFELAGPRIVEPRFYNDASLWVSIFTSPDLVSTILQGLATNALYDGIKASVIFIVKKILSKKPSVISSNDGKIEKKETGTALELKTDGLSVSLKFDYPLSPTELEAYFTEFRQLEKGSHDNHSELNRDWVIFEDENGKIDSKKLTDFLMSQSKSNHK
ncbi:hypothetical protein PQ472_07155 [Lacticaseibacillus pabuli]|uniref:Uncharacterized protein n=1 Tax=Lacticaseibacillus pabuli TaxID=3025672 RepID=A0ABY7WNK6_9LACO|nr:hypothetical protein [Lacticaseibacillus sp. KACC 23028]WDF81706.1 hypothetical protein PQ472_07155 [Lacticaseibacillus sp. KACC 23028]